MRERNDAHHLQVYDHETPDLPEGVYPQVPGPSGRHRAEERALIRLSIFRDRFFFSLHSFYSPRILLIIRPVGYRTAAMLRQVSARLIAAIQSP